MARRSTDGSELRFAAYVRALVSVIGHADRAGPLRDYCLGLIMPGAQERRADGGGDGAGEDRGAASVVAPFRRQVTVVGREGVDQGRSDALLAIESHGPIEAWIIDDTGFDEQGKHSVGVAGQYCGQLGKQDNCQVAVSLSLANHHASLPVAWRLYLPKEWASDEERRRKVGVPEEIEFRTKPQIALEQIEAACEAGLPRGVVLMDAGYGCNTQLRAGVSALALTYVAGILPNTTVWTSDTEPPPPKTWSGRGRRAKRLRRDDGHKPISVEELALGLPRRAWRKITWREGAASGCRLASPACAFAPRIETTLSPSLGRKSGCWSSGPKARRNPPNTGSRRFRRILLSANWWTSPNCAGVSSAIIRN